MDIDGEEIVAGVTSFVQNGCGNLAGDGAARVDTYAGWVQAYIDDHDPASCEADDRCAEGCGAVDPDCPCAVDGFCDALCPAIDTDPDCEGCGLDGTCRADCPVIDGDCCGADGECYAGCGQTDPDCLPDPEPEDPTTPSEPPTQPASPADRDGSDMVGEVVCALRAPGGDAPRLSWLLSLAALALVFRRRR
jgi:hypothetical protein